MVSRGVKPVYSLVCDESYWNALESDLITCISSYGIYHLDTYHEIDGAGYISLRLFKYPYLLDIIRYTDRFKTNGLSGADVIPKEFIIFREWALGKMYGFGDVEIGEHIEQFLPKMYGK